MLLFNIISLNGNKLTYVMLLLFHIMHPSHLVVNSYTTWLTEEPRFRLKQYELCMSQYPWLRPNSLQSWTSSLAEGVTVEARDTHRSVSSFGILLSLARYLERLLTIWGVSVDRVFMTHKICFQNILVIGNQSTSLIKIEVRHEEEGLNLIKSSF